MNPICYKMEKK